MSRSGRRNDRWRGCTCRHTDWAWCIGVVETSASCCQPVEVGRFRDAAAIATRQVALVLVRQDEQEISGLHVGSSLGSDFNPGTAGLGRLVGRLDDACRKPGVGEAAGRAAAAANRGKKIAGRIPDGGIGGQGLDLLRAIAPRQLQPIGRLSGRRSSTRPSAPNSRISSHMCRPSSRQVKRHSRPSRSTSTTPPRSVRPGTRACFTSSASAAVRAP